MPEVQETGQLPRDRGKDVSGMQSDVHGNQNETETLFETMRVTDCPPLAWHCFQIAWFHNNPLPDINVRYCRTCECALPSWENRANCEKCRFPNGEKHKRYPKTCEVCGNDFMADKKYRRFCGMKCAAKGYKRNDW